MVKCGVLCGVWGKAKFGAYGEVGGGVNFLILDKPLGKIQAFKPMIFFFENRISMNPTSW